MTEFGDDWSDKPVRTADGVFAGAVVHGPWDGTRVTCSSGSWTKPTRGTTRT